MKLAKSGRNIAAAAATLAASMMPGMASADDCQNTFSTDISQELRARIALNCLRNTNILNGGYNIITMTREQCKQENGYCLCPDGFNENQEGELCVLSGS